MAYDRPNAQHRDMHASTHLFAFKTSDSEGGKPCEIQNYPGKRPQTVCVRSVSRKSRDLDALGSREVMVVMK